MDMEQLKQDIARIYRGCNLACGKKKECWSECDKCCAEEVVQLLIERGLVKNGYEG